MELNELLKQLKNINPDREYTKRSRMLLVHDFEKQRIPSLWTIVSSGFQFGSAIALSTVLILLVVGGFSAFKYLSPFQAASLDPVGLRAEAQAVDIQIQLTGIAYREPLNIENETSTIKIAPTPTETEAKKQAKNLGLQTETVSSTAMSIDEALGELSK